jgi:hypothetical protein
VYSTINWIVADLYWEIREGHDTDLFFNYHTSEVFDYYDEIVHPDSIVEAVDEHRGVRGEGGGGFTLNLPWQISKDLFKNAIKPRIGGSPGNFYWKPWPLPPSDFGKNFSYPLPWVFNLCTSMFEAFFEKPSKNRKSKRPLRTCRGHFEILIFHGFGHV